MTPRLQHVVLTRFSLRPPILSPGQGAPAPVHWRFPRDPLDPLRLELRLRLLRAFSLASLRAQTCQDFVWIILIDEHLKPAWRDRLAELVSPLPRHRIVTVASASDLAGARWLEPFVATNTTHLVTSNLDDDDLLAPGFVANVRKRLEERSAAGRLPDFITLGVDDYLQWDLLRSSRASLGYLKPWTRGDHPASAGYTLCARRPAYDLSVLGLTHARNAMYFDHERARNWPAGDLRLAVVRRAAEGAGDDWRQWSVRHNYIPLHAPGGGHPALAVMTNHLENDEHDRLFETPAARQPAEPHGDGLLGFPVDLGAVRRVLDSLGWKSWGTDCLRRRAVFRILGDRTRPLTTRLQRALALLSAW